MTRDIRSSPLRLGLVTALLAVSISTPPVRAQDPMQVAPGSYRLDFENDLVKVVHVLYPPHAKLPAHDHPKGPTAYVYLTDSGPILFTHIGLERAAPGKGSWRAALHRWLDPAAPRAFRNEEQA